MLGTFPRILQGEEEEPHHKRQPADKCNLDVVCNISPAASNQSVVSLTKKQHLVDAKD